MIVIDFEDHDKERLHLKPWLKIKDRIEMSMAILSLSRRAVESVSDRSGTPISDNQLALHKFTQQHLSDLM
jgi:hypothetical protein